MIKNYLRQVNPCKQHSRCEQQGWGCQARALITQQVGSCGVGAGFGALSDWHPSCGTGNAEFPEENDSMRLSLVSTPKCLLSWKLSPSAHRELSGSLLCACVHPQSAIGYLMPTTPRVLCKVPWEALAPCPSSPVCALHCLGGETDG